MKSVNLYSTMDGGWVQTIVEIREELSDMDGLLRTIARDVILPELRANYFASGLHVRTGRLLAAISEEGAVGNFINVNDNTVEVGIDTSVEPYFGVIIYGHQGYMTTTKTTPAKRMQTKMTVYKPYQGKGDQIYQLSQAALDKAGDIVVNWYSDKISG
jgi:hypothetical protein